MGPDQTMWANGPLLYEYALKLYMFWDIPQVKAVTEAKDGSTKYCPKMFLITKGCCTVIFYRYL